MSGVEALARALCIAEGVDPDNHRSPSLAPHYVNTARRILADPGPLLAGLAEAGVLAVEHVGRYHPHPPRTRYTTGWVATDG